MTRNPETLRALSIAGGALLGGMAQGVLNHVYAWLTSILWNWPPMMQWAILYENMNLSPMGLWHTFAGMFLGAVAGQCWFLCGQGRPQEAAKRALKVGLSAAFICISFVGVFLYTYFRFSNNNWCGTSAMLPNPPTGLRSFTAQVVGSVTFTNVPLQSSLLLCIVGWRLKRN
jgi:hypothetical protein